jgi:hypothetical protein
MPTSNSGEERIPEDKPPTRTIDDETVTAGGRRHPPIAARNIATEALTIWKHDQVSVRRWRTKGCDRGIHVPSNPAQPVFHVYLADQSPALSILTLLAHNDIQSIGGWYGIFGAGEPQLPDQVKVHYVEVQQMAVIAANKQASTSM